MDQQKKYNRYEIEILLSNILVRTSDGLCIYTNTYTCVTKAL